MGSEAFDRMMERLDSEDREHIHQMAISYGLNFDDPSWVPFAITQMTLFEMEDLSADTVKEIEKATDRALNRIGSKAQEVSREARKVIEEQAGPSSNCVPRCAKSRRHQPSNTSEY